jgi:hypothetical protein
MNRLFLLLSFLIASTAVRAQFNDSIHHYIRYAATGVINQTNNTRSYLLSNALRYNLRKKNKSANFSGSHVYGQQNNVVSNRDLNAAFDFNLLPKDSSKLYYWGRVNYDKSYSLRINGRIQAGGGIAYNFFDNSKRFLNLSEGVLYEKSNLKLTDSTNNVYSILRNSIRLRYRFQISKILVVDGANFLQNSFEDHNDYIINLNNNLSLKLRSWLSFTANFTYNRINNTASDNLLITFGLQAERYF